MRVRVSPLLVCVEVALRNPVRRFVCAGVSEVAVRGNSVVEFTPEEYFGRTALKGIEEEAAEAEKEVAKMEKPADRRPLKSDRQHVAVFQQEHLSYSEKKFKEIKVRQVPCYGSASVLSNPVGCTSLALPISSGLLQRGVSPQSTRYAAHCRGHGSHRHTL